MQTRMMTIADIYDALTATDRPYKRAVPTERALDILHDEAKDGMLDAHLLTTFVEAKVFAKVTPSEGTAARRDAGLGEDHFLTEEPGAPRAAITVVAVPSRRPPASGAPARHPAGARAGTWPAARSPFSRLSSAPRPSLPPCAPRGACAPPLREQRDRAGARCAR